MPDVFGEALRRHPEVVFHQTTNASLLTAGRLQSLRGISKAGFTISIDTVDALTYASIRRLERFPEFWKTSDRCGPGCAPSASRRLTCG
ncbi:MAG: hypothetical protein LLG06_18945 [Desulfobacteraceae bacterium]|nr:hypothetical protein [Desulfobacteraceae bacterium]